MNIFGFKIKRNDEPLLSFTPKLDDEGAVVVNEGGIYGTYVDLDGTIRTEAELVNRYRDMAQYPELDYAIDDITNEVITQEPEVPTVELILDDLEQPEKVKNVLLEEFENILRLMEFNSIAYEIFRRWYIDGRLYYHAIIDNDDPSKGILELRYIDPRKIRKVKPVSRKRVGTGLNSTTIAIDSEEYYIYNESGFGMTRTPGVNPEQTVAAGIKISKDSIVHCTSGLSSINGDLVLGYLHKAIKPLNVLKAMEDALVIYRISRAPERRIFYVDVGNLPKHKAEQYLKDQMNRFKNKLVYNADTGEIRNNYRHQTMLEDFWLARRDGQRGTEITTLPSGAALDQIEDVRYFQNKLYRSLNVPISRLESDSQFTFGRASEITRDEVKFAKFVNRLRGKFSVLFLKILERQLILKNIITPDEWDEFKENIRFKYAQDNYYAELKESEMLRDRMSILRDVDEYQGKYFSAEWIRRHVLRQTDDDIKEIDKEIKAELDNPQYNPPEEEEPNQDQAQSQEEPQDPQALED